MPPFRVQSGKSYHDRCCNPLKLKRHLKKKNLRTVSAKLVEKVPALKAGDRLCPFCRRKIVKQKSLPTGSQPGTRESSQASFVQSSSSLSDLSHPTNSQQSDVSAVTQLPIINEAIAILGHSPIPPRKLDNTNPNQNWIRKKVFTVAAKLRNSLNLPPNEVDIDDNDVDEKARFHDEMITQLKRRFTCTTSYSERVQILTLLPQAWSVAKIKRKFGATEYMVKAAKRIFERKGVLGLPDAKKLGTPLSEENKLKIYQFYEDEESSTMMPGMKDVKSVKTSTGGRVSKQKRLICCNLVELYKLFKDRNPVIEVGFSKFASLRPQHCVLAGSNGTHVVCVCPYHENMKLMLLGSKLKLLTMDQDPINDYEDVLSLLTCDDPTDACYFRTCSACPGDRLLRDLLCEAFTNHNKTTVTYNEWITTPRTTLAEFEISSEEFIDRFCDKAVKLLRHAFIAKRQAVFFRNLKENLNETECVVICDFAENYAFVAQNAIPGFHWNNDQATIFPAVVYYKENGILHHKSLVIVSDCLKHDAVAVAVFLRIVNKFIKRTVLNVSKIYYFSDGAPSQFKNFKHFSNICYHKHDFGIDIEWHYFATAHGKGPCDGSGGTFKRLAAKASLQLPPDKQILTPMALYNWAKQESNLPSISVEFSSTVDYLTMNNKLISRFIAIRKIPDAAKVHAIIPLMDGKVRSKFYSESSECRTHLIIGEPRKN